MTDNENNNPPNIEIRSFSFTVTEAEKDEDITFTPSRFATIHEWLTYICEKEQPAKDIQTFSFELVETSKRYIVCLYGTNDYETARDSYITQVDFRPSEYFLLPRAETKGLNRAKVMAKIEKQLEDFCLTERFKHSFLAKAQVINRKFSV